MRKVSSALLLCVLAGCVTTNTKYDKEKVSTTLSAFEALCLATAPDFASAGVKAAPMGFGDPTDLGLGKLYFTPNNEMGLQVKEGKECAVTMESEGGRQITNQFISLVGRYAETTKVDGVPFVASLNGENFIFMHDPNGGEAFVMLKP